MDDALSVTANAALPPKSPESSCADVIGVTLTPLALPSCAMACPTAALEHVMNTLSPDFNGTKSFKMAQADNPFTNEVESLFMLPETLKTVWQSKLELSAQVPCDETKTLSLTETFLTDEDASVTTPNPNNPAVPVLLLFNDKPFT